MHRRLSSLFLVGAGFLLTAASPPSRPGLPAAHLTRIAHAAGMYQGFIYTNSMEALEENYRQGFRLFEIDFHWTSDRRLVCFRDWEQSLRRVINPPPNQPNYEEFLALRMTGGMHPCTLDSLSEWMRQHPDTMLVTDIKQHTIEALSMILQAIPDATRRVIAQIYTPDEYGPARDLGYSRLVWTLYRYHETPQTTINQARSMRLEGIAIPLAWARKSAWRDAFIDTGLPIYTHTVNDCSLAEALAQSGIRGIYTDTLAPGACTDREHAQHSLEGQHINQLTPFIHSLVRLIIHIFAHI